MDATRRRNRGSGWGWFWLGSPGGGTDFNCLSVVAHAVVQEERGLRRLTLITLVAIFSLGRFLAKIKKKMPLVAIVGFAFCDMSVNLDNNYGTLCSA